MNIRTRSIALGSIALLALAACSSPDTTTPESGATPAAPVPAEAAPPQTEDALAEPEPEPTPEGPERNARGNIPMAIGETAVITSTTTGETAVSIVVTGITPSFQCTNTSYPVDPPVNGTYMAITLDVTTGTPAALQEVMYGSFGLDSYSFTVFNPEGTRENDSTGNAYQCLEDGQELPTSMGPGEHATGIVVLDTAHATGSIAYSPSYDGGFEWGF